MPSVVRDGGKTEASTRTHTRALSTVVVNQARRDHFELFSDGCAIHRPRVNHVFFFARLTSEWARQRCYAIDAIPFISKKYTRKYFRTQHDADSNDGDNGITTT